MRRSHARLLLPLLLCLLVPRGAAAQADEDSTTYARNHKFTVLEPDAAEALAARHCYDNAVEVCAIAGVYQEFVAVEADARTHARIAAAFAEAEVLPASQVFHLTILEAVRNGDHGLEGVTPAARRAIGDAREFLPYNGYKVLGTSVLRTNRSAKAIVNGPSGADYRCSITFHDTIGLDGHRLVVRRLAIDRLHPEEEMLNILDTSFGMKPGETIVVGTSKLEGADRALVVLLSSVG